MLELEHPKSVCFYFFKFAHNLSPFIVRWYLRYVKDSKQRVARKGICCDWMDVSKGTIQGIV